jgi:iron(III) transport system permease protein
MTAALRSMDPSLEEAALMAGANMFTTLRRITLRLMLPAVGSVLLIMFIRALEGFEVPAFIGLAFRYRVFTSRIYLSLRDFPPDYGIAGAYSLILIAISATGIYFYNRATARSEQFATVTGKAFRPRKFELGKWRWVAVAIFILYFLLIVILPFFILFWFSLVPYQTPPAWSMLPSLTFNAYKNLNVFACLPNQNFCIRAQQAFFNSLWLGAGAATIVVLLTAVVSWINVRTRWRGRTLLDILTFLPIAIPGLVVAVSLMWVYLTFKIGIYGTLWILLIAYVTRFMPYGMRTISATMVQINRELEEASQIAGASWFQSFRRITLPLLKPGLIAAWVYILIVSMRELSTSVLLAGPQSQVLATLIFDMRDSGNTSLLAALAVIFMVLLLMLVTLAHFLGGKFGIQE